MIIKNGKINWLYIFIVVIFSVVIGGMVLFLQQNLSKELASSEMPIIQKPISKPTPKPVPLPTEINQNFLTQVNECFIPVAKIYGYTLRITSGFRSMDEQTAIYASGRTSNGHIVSWSEPGKSLHNYGFAVDVVDRWRGYYINWARLGEIGVYCGLEQVDDPHFEHRRGLTTNQFVAGIRPMPLTLPCAIMDERAKAKQLLTPQDLKDCGVPDFSNSG